MTAPPFKKKATVVHEGPKILYLDIETAPIESYHWGLWQQNIGLNQINVEWTILSFSWSWDHEPESRVGYMDTFDQEDMRDDTSLLLKMWELLDQADFVVAQNGKRFDMKKIKARMVMAGMPPFSPVVVIDTLLIAKGEFGFTSNKLEWMSDKLSPIKKRKHGKFPGFDLWRAFLDRTKAARNEMRLYNRDDVRSLRHVYYRLRPWATGHPNVGALFNDEVTRCPKCGSEDVQHRGTAYTNSGEYPRIRCNTCRGWSRGRYTTNTLRKRKANLSN